MQNNNDIQPSASIGDLVHIDGYGDRVYCVDSYTVQHNYEKNASYSEVIYDLSCPFTLDYIIGDDDDITVVCKAEGAEAYLAKIEPSATNDYPTFLYGYDLSPYMPVKQPPKPAPTKRKVTKQAEVDALLDEYIAVKTVIENGITMDERLAEVEAKLKEVSGG